MTKSQILDEESFFISILQKYLHLVNELALIVNKQGNSAIINLNEELLLSAVRESHMDYEFMKKRRVSSIVSEGKIAGILAFRLSRVRPIYSPSTVLNNEFTFVDLHITLAVHIALNYICIKWGDLDKMIRKEIFYTIKSRHVNQETLGLVFDSILKSRELIQQPIALTS